MRPCYYYNYKISTGFTTEDYLANNGYPEKLEEINKHISERKT